VYAITFDLDTSEVQKHFPRSSSAYDEIRSTLKGFGFDWIQGSVYTTTNDDLADLMSAILALKALTWFPSSVRDIRVFRIEQWSDFTAFVKTL
jgi:virulence-associated protein VapD